MAVNGGKRPGSGRKKTLKAEITGALRERMTDAHFDLAVKTVIRCVRQKKNPKLAFEAAVFIIENKIGKAKQAVDMTVTEGVKVIRDTI